MARQVKKVTRQDVEVVEIDPVESNAKPVETNAAPAEVVGNMNAKPVEASPVVGKPDTFKRIKCSRAGWIKMTVEEALEYQNQGILVGHDIKEGIGLLNE